MMEAARGLGEAPGLATSKTRLGGGDPSSVSRWAASACQSLRLFEESLALSTFAWLVDARAAMSRPPQAPPTSTTTAGRDGASARRRRARRRVANARAPTAAPSGLVRVALVPAGAVEQRGSDELAVHPQSAEQMPEVKAAACRAQSGARRRPRRRPRSIRRRPARRQPSSRRRQCRLCRPPCDRRRPRGQRPRGA